MAKQGRSVKSYEDCRRIFTEVSNRLGLVGLTFKYDPSTSSVELLEKHGEDFCTVLRCSGNGFCDTMQGMLTVAWYQTLGIKGQVLVSPEDTKDNPEDTKDNPEDTEKASV